MRKRRNGGESKGEHWHVEWLLFKIFWRGTNERKEERGQGGSLTETRRGRGKKARWLGGSC